VSGEMSRIRVVIVDDHALIRQGVRAFLDTQPDIEVVGEAANGDHAVAICAELLPDVVLLDLLMPGMDGIECTRSIKRDTPGTQVVILSSFHEDEQIIPAIRAGAISYLLKDISPGEMVEAIRKAAAGQIVLSSQVASHILKALGCGPAAENPIAALSDRELEILRLIADGLNNASIGQQLFISEKTVKSHVRNILAKLQLSDRTQAAAYAWRSGLVRRPR
jgi:NarL family two-component system response regulator LiaR